MNGALAMLMRLFVQRYYFLNGGFFLVVFLLLFGVIEPAASIRLHADLMVLMGSRPALLTGALGILALYLLKCLRFALQQPGLAENTLLYELQALPRTTLRRYLGIVAAALYGPALLYAGCLIGVCVANGAWVSAAVTAATQLLGLLVVAGMLERRLLLRTQESRLDRLMQRLDALRPPYLRFGQYFTAQLLHEKKLMLLLLKTGSLLLLQLMVYINREEPERAGTFYVLLFLIVAHGLIPWQLRQFTEALPWLRNLPIPVLRRYAAFAGTYALLFLPELIFLLLHVRTTLSFSDMLSFYVLSLSMMCGMHAVLYLPGLNMERYLLFMLLLYPLSIISLAMISPWVLAGFWAASSAIIFSTRYYRFELPGGGENE